MNYIKLEHWNPFRSKFIYLDTPDYLADQIFINEKIRVRFSDKEWQHDDWEFVLVYCDVARKDEPRFTRAMEKLRTNMMILGFDRYEDACQRLRELIGEN